MSPNLRGALFMVLSMAGFTLNDTMVKLASDSVPLFQIVFLRGVATTAMLAVTVHLAGGLRFAIPRGDRGKVAWRTGLEVVTMVAFLTALVNMPIANATAILSALPLFVTLGAALFFGDPLGWRRMTAICLGFLGVMMIIQPGAEGFNAYALLALLAALLVTGRDLVTRAFSPEVPSMSVAVITAAAVAVLGGVLSIFEGWVALGWREAALILAAAVFIIAGYVFSIMVMRVGDISFTAPFRYTSLIWALLLGFLVFGNWPNALALTGAALVVGTGLFTFWREQKLARAPRAG
jgi:S-adenosylmethionine uptake transporter